MKTLLKIFFPVFLAIILIVSLELTLRFSDYGYSASYVIQRSTPTGPKAVLNPAALSTYTNAGVINSYNEPFLNIPVEKPTTSIRVIVLGGSSAYGAYLVPYASFARYLEAMLSLRFPEHTIDVINQAFPSLNTSAMVQVLKDSLLLEPDMVVCYEAFNDWGRVISRQGGKWAFPLEEVSYALKRLKIYQLTVNCAGKYIRRIPEFLLKKDDAGFQYFPSMTPEEIDFITSAFRYNMEKITSICQGEGIPVFLCTYAYNMKNLNTADPFSGNTSPEEIEAHLFLLQQAYAFEKAGDYWTAIFYYERFCDLFPQFADPLCHIAFCYFALGLPEEAAVRYEKARVLSDGSLEKTEALNMVLRDMASLSSDDGIFLVDIVDALKQSSLLGFMPGEEYFGDQIHFTAEGSYEVAANIYRSIALSLTDDVVAPPPAKAECDSRLGLLHLLREKELIDANIKQSLSVISALLVRLPIGYTLMHDVTKEYRLNQMFSGGFVFSEHQDDAEIIRNHPQSDNPDYYFHKDQIVALSMQGKPAQALTVAERLVEATDRHSLSLKLYGQTLLRDNQPEAALKIFKEAIGQPVRIFDLNLRLSAAEAALNSGRPEEALDILETGWRIIQNNGPVTPLEKNLFAGFQQIYLAAMKSVQPFLSEPAGK